MRKKSYTSGHVIQEYLTLVHETALLGHNTHITSKLPIVNNTKYRRAIAKFRTGSHNLRIETGRYKTRKLNERICLFFKARNIDDR